MTAQLSNWQCCHMLACWTQQTQPSPTFIQHSFEQWVQLTYQVLSFEKSHWAGLGQILGRCLCNHRKTLTKVQKVTFDENKDAVRKRLWICLSLHSCQTGNVATCWHVELSKLSLLQLSFNIHLSNWFSCPIKCFHLKTAIGLALGESWGVACATTEKHWCPVSTFACFGNLYANALSHLTERRSLNVLGELHVPERATSQRVL